MYNYNNMNYMPYNSKYNTDIYQNYNMNNMEQTKNSNYNTYQENLKQSQTNNTLKNKLNNEAGNNMNFNKPNYIQNITPNDLYEVYTGFIRGNMFKDLYNSYKIKQPYEIKPLNEQAEMLTYIYAYSFASHDLNLYLDTHPNDKNILNLFKTFNTELNKITNNYEKKYGPIYVNSTERIPWSWNESPWPWENE